MAETASQILRIAVSSRALFELSREDEIFRTQGEYEYAKYQIENEDVPLQPGTGFPLIEALLGLNDRVGKRIVCVGLLSQNTANTGLRITNSIAKHRLDIELFSFTGGEPAAPYLAAHHVHLFLSADDTAVSEAIQHGYPAGLVYPPPLDLPRDHSQVRLAFDGDSVLFSDEADKVYQAGKLPLFQEHEIAKQDVPLPPGPLKPFFDVIASMQKEFGVSNCPIHTGLFTARNSPAHIRAIKTFRAWGIEPNQSHYIGNRNKTDFLQVFKPHIYFDDNETHVERCASSICAARVLTPAWKQPPAAASSAKKRPKKVVETKRPTLRRRR